MLTLGFVGENARIPLSARSQLLEKWLAQALDSLALAQRYGLNLAPYQRDVARLRADLAALDQTPQTA